MKGMIDFLDGKDKVLFLTTSSRWFDEKGGETPKSGLLASYISKKLLSRVEVVDVSRLRIYECEGNVSTAKGNACGRRRAS